MKRIINKGKNFKEAEEWEIRQEVLMTPEERQKIAKRTQKKILWRQIQGRKREL